jgi:ComF family protein
MQKLKTIINNFLDILFPRTTLQKKIDNISDTEVLQLARPNTIINTDIIAVFDYKDKLIKEMIWSLKFRGRKNLANIFAKILYDEIIAETAELEIFNNFTQPILISIPLSKKRLNERGYNQSDLIAQKISILGTGYLDLKRKNLVRIKNTPPQSSFKNRRERLKNLQDCFAVRNPHEIKGRNVVLIDDVTTTGATIKEASKALKQAEVKKIIAFTVAH